MSPHSRPALGRSPSSQLATRIAFSVIILFVLAQVGWWMIFQQRYMGEVTRVRLAAWQQDAVTANELLAAAGGDEAVAEELLQRFPQLSLNAVGRFVVDQGTREEFIHAQRSYMRMFAFEVPFFVLVVLLSLVFIASTLRNERELKRRQQNFMSAVTHEFKTPISTLRLLIETALMRSLPAEKSREYLQRMAAEVARLEQTSDQVLASARLEQAPEPRVLAPFDMADLVSDNIKRLRQGLEARGAVLKVQLPGGPVPVSVDENAFSMVLSNLLDNAIKYSPAEVKLVMVRLETSGDLALLHVEDQGIGVADGERKKIFERFYRSGDEMTREATGIGLGLHLVRSTVEAMNGWVRCTNREEGPGARFTVVLPLRQSVPQVAPEPGTGAL